MYTKQLATALAHITNAGWNTLARLYKSCYGNFGCALIAYAIELQTKKVGLTEVESVRLAFSRIKRFKRIYGFSSSKALDKLTSPKEDMPAVSSQKSFAELCNEHNLVIEKNFKKPINKIVNGKRIAVTKKTVYVTDIPSVIEAQFSDKVCLKQWKLMEIIDTISQKYNDFNDMEVIINTSSILEYVASMTKRQKTNFHNAYALWNADCLVMDSAPYKGLAYAVKATGLKPYRFCELYARAVA